jgi:BirA family biotin operon repressor/biotin-[acetyl-CoA-carboxylase] ligase
MQLALPGIRHYHFESIVSTQDEIDSYEAQCNDDQWILVTADHQTAGRGTHGRGWHAEPGKNILMTLMLPCLPPEKLRYLTLVVGLTLVQLVQQDYQLDAKLKWVNDVLIDHKKIAGILCNSDGQFCKIGIGFNINSDESHADQIDQASTSLYLETGRQQSREVILQDIVQRLKKNIELLKQLDFQASFLPPIRDVLAYLGEEVVFQVSEEETVQGVLEGINCQGHLLIAGETFAAGRLLVKTVIKLPL